MGKIMLKFASYLSEASLTFGEITREDREFRLELFLRKYKSNEPFDLTDGGQVILKYNAEIERAMKSRDSKRATAIGLETMDGDKISFGKLLKTGEFGGGRGTGGGSLNTRATESAQCVYLQAIWDNPQTNFSPDELRTAYTKTHTDATLDEVLLGDDAWISSSINAAKVLHKVLKKKQYSFHRGSNWVSILDNKFKEVNREEKQFSNLNKWNPSDIWMVAKGAENKYDIEGAKTLQYLNNELLKAYAARDIIGVSLKKVGKKAKLTQVNYKKPFASPKFTKVSYGKRDFFKSKDGYLMYSGGEIQFRTYPTFQCEIIGRDAKHGKLSHGPIDAALYATTRNMTDNRKKLETMIKSDRDGFLKKFYGFYDGAVDKPVDYDTFTKNLEDKTTEWLVSKYYVTSIFVMVKGREQQFLEYLYRGAKSQSKLSSVHLKVQ
tara:strand:- start:565 stop:1872 length:1308 start_codon:yes stop_codon:yes gene_type:complete